MLIMADEIADEITQSAIRFVSEPVQNVQKSVKTIYYKKKELAAGSE